MSKSLTFRKVFLKVKNQENEKIAANTSYDHLCSIQKDSLVPLKLQFFEDITKTLNSLLFLYQTDKLMVPFLAESLETLLRSLCARFFRKDVLESAKTASLLIKLDVADKTNWKDVNSDDLGFGIKYELRRLIVSKKVASMQAVLCKKRSIRLFGKSLQPCN